MDHDTWLLQGSEDGLEDEVEIERKRREDLMELNENRADRDMDLE